MNIAILISGGGSTMERVIKECQSGGIQNSKVVHVIASNAKAGGIAKAEALGVPVTILRPQKDFDGNSVAFGQAIIDTCTSSQADIIAQLGWLAKTPSNVVKKYAGKIINQHPGILNNRFNDFGGQGMHGLTVHQAVINFMKKIGRPIMTEATVHIVTENYDDGVILGVKGVPILADDTAETLAARVLPYEHELVVEILRRLAYGQVIEILKHGNLVREDEMELFENAIKEAKQQHNH